MGFRQVVIWAALVAMTGCDRLAGMLPAENVEATTASSQAPDDTAGYDAESRRDDFGLDAEAEEASAMAACPAVERDGAVLRLKAGGKAVATLTDRPDSAWLFTQCFSAPAPEGRTMQYFVFEQAERIEISRYSLIVDEAGVPVDRVPSHIRIHDGPLIAGGYIGEDAGDFVILDWRQPRHVRYKFDGPPCLPQAWRSDSELTVKCGWVYQDAAATTVRRVGPSAWRILPDGKPVEAKVGDKAFSAEFLDILAEQGFVRVTTP